MTGCAASEQEEKRFGPWEEARQGDPDERTKKKMLAEALCVGVEFVMSNHLYMFNKVAGNSPRADLSAWPLQVTLLRFLCVFMIVS